MQSFKNQLAFERTILPLREGVNSSDAFDRKIVQRKRHVKSFDKTAVEASRLEYAIKRIAHLDDALACLEMRTDYLMFELGSINTGKDKELDFFRSRVVDIAQTLYENLEPDLSVDRLIELVSPFLTECGKLGLDALQENLRNERRHSVVMAILKGLGMLDQAWSEEPRRIFIESFVTSENAGIRTAAVFALASLGSPRSLDALTNSLQTENNPVVVNAIQSTVAALRQ